MFDVEKEALRLQEAGVDYALATVVRAQSPTAAKPGAKAILLSDGTMQGWVGGGCAQPAVKKTAKQCLADGQARLIRVSPDGKSAQSLDGIVEFKMNCPSGGSLDIFIEAKKAKPCLWVVGESPTAKALVELSRCIGLEVCELNADAKDAPERQKPDTIVIATQGKGDVMALTNAVKMGSPYIAFIASEKKGNKYKKKLIDQGLDRQIVQAIRVPAGINIGAETPEEIALSVLASIVAARRGVTGAEQETTNECCEAPSVQADVFDTEAAPSCCGG